MSGVNKHKATMFHEFLRYIKGEMSGKEKNLMEREFQKDPFAEEAAEGYATIPADLAAEDLKILHNRLAYRINHKSKIAIFSIAASIAVIMVISAVFIVTHDKNKVIVLSENIPDDVRSSAPPPVSPASSVPEPENKTAEKKAEEDQIAEQYKTEQSATDRSELISDEAEAVVKDLPSASEKTEAVKLLTAEKSMEMARAAGTPVSIKTINQGDYSPPQPVVGTDSFNIYLEKNTRNPEPDKPGQQVVISFKVGVNNKISSIRIITSPGNKFSQEAVRLIKEGPEWKHAVRTGEAVEEEIIVPIIFR